MEIVGWVIAHYMEVISAVVALLSGVVAVALIIPGDEPEKSLGKVLEVLKKISKK